MDNLSKENENILKVGLQIIVKYFIMIIFLGYIGTGKGSLAVNWP
jgi:hypothetical protein